MPVGGGWSCDPLGAIKDDWVGPSTERSSTMYETDLDRERERLYSRLSTLPGIHPMPSIRNWVLVETHNPRELARRINRRIAPGTVSVPRQLSDAIRIPVRDPKSNELVFGIIRDLTNKRADEEAAREEAESSAADDSAAEVG